MAELVEWIRTEVIGDDVLKSAWGGPDELPRQWILVEDVPEEQVFVLDRVPAPR